MLAPILILNDYGIGFTIHKCSAAKFYAQSSVREAGSAAVQMRDESDNLVHAIHRALTVTGADREAFLLGDREMATWADVYHHVADALGVPHDAIADISPPAFRLSLPAVIDRIRSHEAAQAVLPYIPSRLKRIARAALAAWPEQQSRSPWALPAPLAPIVTREFADLHQCPVELPWEKARRILGYEPAVTLEEGLRRTVAWLGFAGLPLASKGPT